jgi:hypothetical protein
MVDLSCYHHGPRPHEILICFAPLQAGGSYFTEPSAMAAKWRVLTQTMTQTVSL